MSLVLDLITTVALILAIVTTIVFVASSVVLLFVPDLGEVNRLDPRAETSATVVGIGALAAGAVPNASRSEPAAWTPPRAA